MHFFVMFLINKTWLQFLHSVTMCCAVTRQQNHVPPSVLALVFLIMSSFFFPEALAGQFWYFLLSLPLCLFPLSFPVIIEFTSLCVFKTYPNHFD